MVVIRLTFADVKALKQLSLTFCSPVVVLQPVLYTTPSLRLLLQQL